MTVQSCLTSARNRIFDQWLMKTTKEIPATLGQPKPALVNSLSKFLDHLIEMLEQKNSETSDFDYKLLASEHGIQRARVGSYTLKQVSFEFTLLQQVVFDILKECDGPTVEESKIISLCFQTAVSEAGASFVEAMDEARERSETQFKLLVQEAKDYAIIMIDPKGTISSWNWGAERMKQYTAQEVIGENYSILYRIEDQKAGRPQKNMKLALENGRYHEQWWRKKKNGTLFWADMVMTPVYSRGGELLGFSKIVRDLSSKKRIDDELRAAKVSAEEASGLKSIFVANMSHEIRTPLGAILGFSEVLKDPGCSAENRLLAAEVIDRNGKVLLRLIEDILDISKIEAGKLEIEMGEILLKPFLNDIVELFDQKARDKGLFLKLKTDTNVPLIVVSDSVRLRQILSNVIGNAVKFTEQGEVSVETHRIELSSGQSGIEFIVSDTGAGLTQEQRGDLFSSFSQADSTATRKFGGTGLGLALSRRLARKLGGDIGILDHSAKGGCSFQVTVADGVPIESAKVAIAPSPIGTTIKDSDLKKISGINVLIVDDAKDNQLLIKTVLNKWNVRSDVADDGEEGVDKAMSGNYDLVLMDLQMPILDGNQAIRKLRNAGYTRPIVVLTAHAMNDEKARAFDSGCDDYLTKPIDRSRLFEVLKNHAHR